MEGLGEVVAGLEAGYLGHSWDIVGTCLEDVRDYMGMALGSFQNICRRYTRHMNPLQPYITTCGLVPKPIVYEVHLERACAGGGAPPFCFCLFFQWLSFVISPGGPPRPPRGTQKRCARGAPTSFRSCLSSPFCCLRCEPMRSTITINRYTKKNK